MLGNKLPNMKKKKRQDFASWWQTGHLEIVGCSLNQEGYIKFSQRNGKMIAKASKELPGWSNGWVIIHKYMDPVWKLETSENLGIKECNHCFLCKSEIIHKWGFGAEA
jgi:hypothetical protein